jgi:MFS family permease
VSSGWGALSVPNYRLYFIGNAITLSGYWLLRIAQSWLVLDLTGSPAALGVLQVAQFLPITILTLFAGVVLDRVKMRWLMVVTSSVIGLVAAIMAVLVLTHTVQFWEVLVLGAIIGIASAFDQPGRSAFANELVGPGRLGNAIALNSSLNQGSRIIGPGIGGVMIALWGTGICFVVAAVSCVGAVAGLAALNSRQLFPKRPAARGAMLNQLMDGLTYSFSTPTLGFQMVIMAFIGTFAFNFGLTLPLLARFALDAGSEGFGVLNMALGIGAVIGGLVLATRLTASLRLIVVSATLFSLLVFSLGLAPNMPTAVVLVALTGALSLAYSASANTLLQMEADDRYRGRVLGLFLLLWSGSTPIGSAVIGWLSDRYDIRLAMEICGAMCLLGVVVAVAYLLLARRRSPRKPLVAVPARLEDV